MEADYTCPICYELLYDPVRSDCGHHFCSHCLKKWCSVNEGVLTCPLDRQRMEEMPPEVDDDLKRKIVAVHREEYAVRAVAVSEQKAEQLMIEVRMLATRSCANSRLVENLRNLEGRGALRQGSPLETAFLQLPRGEFVPPTHRTQAYSMQQPLHIALLQFNVTAASLHVLCLNLLDPQPGEAFLDVGTGSGIVAALAAQLVGRGGVVHGTDVRPAVLAFATRNIEVQRSRVAAAEVERRLHSAPAGHPASALLPGVVFLGTHKTHKVYLLVDTRCGSSFRGRLHWPNRGKTTDFYHATFTEEYLNDDSDDDRTAGKPVLRVQLTEDQVLVTRFMWDQLSWVPSTYDLTFDGERFKGDQFTLEKVSDNALGPAPCLSNIAMFNANIFSDREMRVPLRELPPITTEDEGGGADGGTAAASGNTNTNTNTNTNAPRLYDKIHCAANCEEDGLVHILKYLRVGGTLVMPVDGFLCVATRTQEGYELERLTRVRYGQLLSLDDQAALERREREAREEEAAAASTAARRHDPVAAARGEAGNVYVSKCCGLPIAHKRAVVDLSAILGGGLELDDGEGLLFPPEEVLSGVAVGEGERPFVSVPHLGGDMVPAQCGGCGCTLGFVFRSEPPERAGGESWRGRYLLCSTYLALGGLPEASPANLIRCGNPTCRHPLSRREQILSSRHKWRLAGSTKTEPAAYLNGLLPGACTDGAPRDTHLAQGRMRVAPLHCGACRAEVGWRFVSHVCKPQRAKLICYEGRVGLVASRVTGLPSTDLSMSRLFLQSILNRSHTAVVLAQGAAQPSAPFVA